jgi:hypothetical protein
VLLMQDNVVELIKAVAWPFFMLLAAIMFYAPVCRFLEAISARATKLSIFKIEFEFLAGAKSSASPSLDDIKNPEGALVGDSSHTLFQQAQDATPADYALIDIGLGDEWLTSRLFIGAAMLERMRGVECLVFVGRDGAIDRKLLAVVPLRRVRWALAQQQPWLEAAFALAYAETQLSARAPQFPPVGSIHSTPPHQSYIKSLTGGLEPWIAGQLVKRFIELLQDTSAGTGTDWVSLSHGRMEHASWVTTALLQKMLVPEAFEMWAFEDRDKTRAERAKAVVRRKGHFVALVNSDRQFLRLIDRRGLLEDIALKTDE